MKISRWFGLLFLLTLMFVAGSFYGYQKKQPQVVQIGRFDTLDCANCKVVRVTQTTMSGPFIQEEPQQIWEVKAEVGQKLTDLKNQWTMEITEVTNKEITLTTSGKLYNELTPIEKVIKIKLDTPKRFNTGTVGGGTDWEVIYYDRVLIE